MRPLLIKLTLASLLFGTFATHASVVSITATATLEMPDYEMSDTNGIGTPFGFNASGPLISSGDTVASMAFLMTLTGVDPGTTISSVYVNYNSAGHHVCDPFTISIRPNPLAAGIVTVSCNFTTPFAMPDYTSWFTGFASSQPGTTTLHFDTKSLSSLTFSDAPLTAAPEPTCFLFAGTGILLVAVGRERRFRWRQGKS